MDVKKNTIFIKIHPKINFLNVIINNLKFIKLIELIHSY